MAANDLEAVRVAELSRLLSETENNLKKNKSSLSDEMFNLGSQKTETEDQILRIAQDFGKFVKDLEAKMRKGLDEAAGLRREHLKSVDGQLNKLISKFLFTLIHSSII
jgi:hypothetical protein